MGLLLLNAVLSCKDICSYDFPNSPVSSRAYVLSEYSMWYINVQNVDSSTVYVIVRLLANTRLLLVNFEGSQKLQVDF